MLEITSTRDNLKLFGNNLISENEKQLKCIKSTVPEHIDYAEVPTDSFEIDVDLVNHLSSSGMISKLQYNLNKK